MATKKWERRVIVAEAYQKYNFSPEPDKSPESTQARHRPRVGLPYWGAGSRKKYHKDFTRILNVVDHLKSVKRPD